MVTDVFDSRNFRPGKNHDAAAVERYQYANATILSQLIFSEQPLMLTIPQLYDGYFSTCLSGFEGVKSMARRKEMLFDLMREGHIRICIYHQENGPLKYHVRNVWEYMERIPFQNPNYEYSSMPVLYDLLQSEEHKTVQELFGKVKDYILALGQGERKNKNFICDANCFGDELAGFLDFMTEFHEVEQQCSDLYRIYRVQLPEFNTMLTESLPASSAEVYSLLSLSRLKNSEELLQQLLSCKTRSDCNTLINGEKFADLDVRERAVISDVISVIYNKHSLSAFPNAVIHAPQNFTDAQKFMLKNIIESRVENGNAVTLSIRGKNTYAFRNTEVLEQHAADGSVLTLENALEMREEIRAVRTEKKCSWQDAVQHFRMKHIMDEIHIGDIGYSFSIDSSGSKTIGYTSVPEFDFNKALRFDKISHLVSHTHGYLKKD